MEGMDTDGSPVRAIGSDPAAFEAFYREHLPAVRRFVARRVSDPHLAADLTSDVFLAAIDAASSYRPDRGVPAAWLSGIARRVVASEVRRQVGERKATRRVAARRLLDPDSLARMEERLDAEREVRALYGAIARLPERDRALLELVAIDGLEVADAAVVLGIKPGTARVRLHRARRRVQAQIPVPSPWRPDMTISGSTHAEDDLDRFGIALLAELRAVVEHRRPARRRKHVLTLGGAVAAVATAVGLGLTIGGTPAFAVHRESNGDVVVTITRFDDADGLERSLAAQGVTATVDYVHPIRMKTTDGRTLDVIPLPSRRGPPRAKIPTAGSGTAETSPWARGPTATSSRSRVSGPTPIADHDGRTASHPQPCRQLPPGTVRPDRCAAGRHRLSNVAVSSACRRRRPTSRRTGSRRRRRARVPCGRRRPGARRPRP